MRVQLTESEVSIMDNLQKTFTDERSGVAPMSILSEYALGLLILKRFPDSELSDDKPLSVTVEPMNVTYSYTKSKDLGVNFNITYEGD